MEHIPDSINNKFGLEETTDPEEMREFAINCKRNQLKNLNENIKAVEGQIEYTNESILNANDKIPPQPITYKDDAGNTVFMPDKSEKEIQEIIDSGYEHHDDN